MGEIKEQNETIKEKIRKAFSLKEDSASHEEIQARLLDGGQITGTNMCVMVCAMIIASVGLNVSSTAVIIGAMLISPIMGSILASAYGNVSADYVLLRNHMIGLGMQVVISVTAAAIYFFLSPVKEPTVELIARTSPTFFDVLIAFFGGLAENYKKAAKTLSFFKKRLVNLRIFFYNIVRNGVSDVLRSLHPLKTSRRADFQSFFFVR